MSERKKLIEVQDLTVKFGSRRKPFVAVNKVSFDIYQGETFGLVGESGSGKTTIGRAIIRIHPTSGGKVLFAAPDMSPELVALQSACADGRPLNGYAWTPHTTMLMDEPEVIGRALPVLMQHFTPLMAKIDRLHLCAFWPTREILTIDLTGRE